ncbi:MAG: thioredoxin-dependent thiol peroxidase [bacterium]|nr:thioredoxin-dependent thiol peroxidase [bacterium]
MTNLRLGDAAPEFALPDQDGVVRRLTDVRGKWVLLYFYPKDMTPGCTTEACAIRDVWNDFAQQGVVVYGVSTDSVALHRKFVDTHALPFTLLADTEKVVVREYGVWGMKKFMGREYEGTKRVSFLIDPEGMIAKMYETVKPAGHAAEVLADVQELAARRENT